MRLTLNLLLAEEIVRRALLEDLGAGDISSFMFRPEDQARGELLVKEDGVIAGLPVAELTFKLVDSGLRWQALAQDGQAVKSGQRLAEVSGSIAAILAAERTALNFLQRLSGIATATARYAQAIAPHRARIADTRKTVPGLRLLDKYAVRMGGGVNHRLNLTDAVIIKDNHIAAAGSIAAAVQLVRQRVPFTAKVEVEVETLEQAMEALASGADIIMLDNMDTETMRRAVAAIAGQATVEASGGITLANVAAVAATGVDIISSGALTHSVMALDIRLDVLT